MNPILLSILLIIASSISQASQVKQTPQYVMIEAEVYDFEINNELPPETQVQAGELTQNPSLMAELGKDATIEIGKQNDDGTFAELFKLVTTFPKNNPNYLLELHLIKGEYEKVLTIEATLEKTVLITTSIAGLGKGVRIKTQLVDKKDSLPTP